MLTVQHSIVSPRAILKAVQKHYPAVGAHLCELLALGCNTNYLIKGKRNDYVFRLYRHEWWPELEVDEELRFLETLSRRSISVSKPLRTRLKNRYLSMSAAEGRRCGALFVYFPGNNLGHNFGKRNANMFKLGEIVAGIHNTADQLKNTPKRWTMDFDAMVTKYLDQAPSLLGHRPKDLRYLNKLAARLEQVISTQPEGTLNFGLCHGDLHTHNVVLQQDGELVVIDFDWCGYSWRAYDLATVWSSLPRDQTSRGPWSAFLRGYKGLRDLSRQELKLMPWFVVLRQFEVLTFHQFMRKHVGSAWLNDNYYNFQMDFFRNWERQHLL